MNVDFLDYFTNPVFRASTWGVFFMSIASSLMGVLVLLKKRALVTESLSHATYPGVVLGAFIFSFFFPEKGESLFFFVWIGALLSSYLGLKTMEWLEEKKRLSADSSLLFVLSFFFGVGVLLISWLQRVAPKVSQSLEPLLFGQAATMEDMHVFIYGALALCVVLFLLIAYRPLQTLLFDRNYAKSLGMRVDRLEKVLSFFLLFSLILGMRSVGIVLMAGMLIAPAVAARAFSDQLKTVLFFAAVLGALGALLGQILSVELSLSFSKGGVKLFLPTGPMIVLVSASLALFSLLLAPKRGWVFRFFRAAQFEMRCLEENLLKGLWKKGELNFRMLQGMHQVFWGRLFFALFRLQRFGFITKKRGIYCLSSDGKNKAASIVRRHRLWELYLAQKMGFHGKSVHESAEQMEHILTAELEERLATLLENPKRDPHSQPIPEK